MPEEENYTARKMSQEGGFQYHKEFNRSKPTLEGHLETLRFLQQAKEDGMKRATLMNPEGKPITLSIDCVIEIVKELIENKIGNLPLQGK